MRTVLINVKKTDRTFLLNLIRKLGMGAKILSREEVEDWNLGQKIEARMKSKSVRRSRVMKALKK